MLSFAIIFFMIVWVFINMIVYKKVINVPTIITIIWCTSLFFSLLGLYDIFIPPKEVVWYTFIFISSFNIFSIIFNTICKNKTNKIESHVVSNKFLTRILIVCIVVLLIICYKGLLIFFSTYDLDIVRNSYISFSSINMHVQVFLTITFIPLGEAAFIYSIENYNIEKKVRSSLILSIIFIVLVSLLTGGRSMMFFFVLVAIVATVKKGIKAFIIKNKKIIKICLILIATLLIITRQRSFGNNGILNSIYVYFCGCFNLFGVYLNKNMVFSNDLLHGSVLLGGIGFPILQFIRYVFHVNVLPGIYILEEEATSKYLGISPTIAINATPTTMFHAIRDFGLYGLAIYPLIISYIYTKLKKRQNLNIMYESLYTYFISCCFLLHTTYYFGKFQVVSVFLYVYLIYAMAPKSNKTFQIKE